MDLREGSSTDARVADRDGAVLGDLSSALGFPPRRCSRPARVVPDDAVRKRHGPVASQRAAKRLDPYTWLRRRDGVRTRKLARYLSTPDTSLSPEEIERLKEILKQTNRPFYYELQMPAVKRPEEEEEKRKKRKKRRRRGRRGGGRRRREEGGKRRRGRATRALETHVGVGRRAMGCSRPAKDSCSGRKTGRSRHEQEVPRRREADRRDHERHGDRMDVWVAATGRFAVHRSSGASLSRSASSQKTCILAGTSGPPFASGMR